MARESTPPIWGSKKRDVLLYVTEKQKSRRAMKKKVFLVRDIRFTGLREALKGVKRRKCERS